MFRVHNVDHATLESKLNELESDGWEVFAVVPTLKFEKTKVVMATVSLPGNIEYNIIARKYGENPDSNSQGEAT